MTLRRCGVLGKLARWCFLRAALHQRVVVQICTVRSTMAKLSLALVAALAASASAFAPASTLKQTTSLKAATGDIWDPMGLYELGSGEAFDTFPNVFPDKQFLEAAEIKHGRQAMLAWTGVWATTTVRALIETELHSECICSGKFCRECSSTPDFLVLLSSHRVDSDLAFTFLDSQMNPTGPRHWVSLPLNNPSGLEPSWP